VPGYDTLQEHNHRETHLRAGGQCNMEHGTGHLQDRVWKGPSGSLNDAPLAIFRDNQDKKPGPLHVNTVLAMAKG
jgi:hypothetical protein